MIKVILELYRYDVDSPSQKLDRHVSTSAQMLLIESVVCWSISARHIYIEIFFCAYDLSLVISVKIIPFADYCVIC